MVTVAPPVERCANEESVAFDALFDEHCATVFRLALRLLNSREDAEDATAETFVRVHRMLHSFRGEADFAVWLHKSALNVCRQHGRSNRRRASVLPRAADDASHVLRSVQDSADGPEAVVVRRDFEAHVLDAVGRLPAKYEEPIVLHYLMGLTYAQVGGVLGRPVGTVQFQVHVGLGKLRKTLREPPRRKE